jgi:hypothetical protein
MAFEKRIVIDTDNLPLRAPVPLTWLLALSMAVWDWPSWLVGILWFVLALMWIVFVIDRFKNEARRVFEKHPAAVASSKEHL